MFGIFYRKLRGKLRGNAGNWLFAADVGIRPDPAVLRLAAEAAIERASNR